MQWVGTRPNRIVRWVHMLLLAALCGAFVPSRPAAVAAESPDRLDTALRAANPSPALSNGIDLTNDILNNPSAAFNALASAPAADLSIARTPAARSLAELDGDALQVVFRVTNHEPPAARDLLPLQTSPTLSSTAALEHNRRARRADANTLRNVVIVDDLAAGVELLDASHRGARDGGRWVWQLGDIAPQQSVAVTVSLRLPSPVQAWTAFDGGAAAWGSLHGRPVTAQALPIRLAAAAIDGQPIGDWLRSTPDANTADPYVLDQAAALGQNPLAMFAFAQGLGYEAYPGSLRGSRGTLWSGAGNSADQASLLIAMLRSSGVPARYRHGRLGEDGARALIA